MPDPYRKTVSSTEVSALFGISPWLTEFMLYDRFANGANIDPPENERMLIGKLMQPVILELVRRELRLDVEPWDEGHYVTVGSLGATLDATIRCPKRGLGVVECKNVAWPRWRETYTFGEGDECIAAPAYYEIQAHVQMAALEAEFDEEVTWGVIATLVGGNDLVLLERVPDRKLIAQLEERAAGFLERVRGRNAPDPLQAEDLSVVAHLIPEVRREPPLDLCGTEEGATLQELAELYDAHRQVRLDAVKAEDEAKAAALFAVQALAVDGVAPRVTFCDEGTVMLIRQKDTMYTLPAAVEKLVAWCEGFANLDEDEEGASELVAAVRALEQNVARKGGLLLKWKPRKES